MADEDLLQRVVTLEARLAALEGMRAAGETTAPDPEARLFEVVGHMTPRALAIALKGIPLRERAKAFYLAPREVLECIRAGLSERAWEDLVLAWKEGEGYGPRGIYLEHVLEGLDVLFEMGYLAMQVSNGLIDEQIPESPTPRSEEYWARRREEGRQRVNLAQVEARNWLRAEMPETLA